MQTFNEILFCLCAICWTLMGVLEFVVASGSRTDESYFKGILAFGIAAGFASVPVLDGALRDCVMLLSWLGVIWFVWKVDSE